MRTSVEIPDELFRQAKLSSERRGISLNDFLTEALNEKLRRTSGDTPSGQPWIRAFGGLRKLRGETKRINRIVDREFEEIDADQWR
jgi:hypothetical protein